MGRYDGILIVTDFDRTLTDFSGKIPEKNLEAIHRFMNEGGKFTVASGRSVPMFRSKYGLFESNAPVILYNGAVCYDFENERVVFGTPMPDAEQIAVKALSKWNFSNVETQGIGGHWTCKIEEGRLKMFRELGVRIYGEAGETGDTMYMLFLGSTFIRPDDAAHDFQDGTPEDDEMFRECNKWLEDTNIYRAIRSTRLNTEVVAKDVSKGAAARKLSRLLGCGTLVCVGDAMNDLAMLEEADRCFTPKDGSEEIRTILGRKLEIADSCGEGTIADVISRL